MTAFGASSLLASYAGPIATRPDKSPRAAADHRTNERIPSSPLQPSPPQDPLPGDPRSSRPAEKDDRTRREDEWHDEEEGPDAQESIGKHGGCRPTMAQRG